MSVRTSFDSTDEVLKGVSARVGLAITLLENGATEDASKTLQRILAILPVPVDRNIAAALAGIEANNHE